MKLNDTVNLIKISQHKPGQVVSVVLHELKDKNSYPCSYEDNNSITCSFVKDFMSNYVLVEGTKDVYFVKTSIYGYKGNQSAMVLYRERHFFSDKNLIPVFNNMTLKFEYELSEKTLNTWVDLGLLKKEMQDSYFGCPHCNCLGTVREGCEDCWSVNIKKENMIRHYPCRYIGLCGQFTEGKCPNCHQALKLAAYDVFDGPANCQDCQFSGQNPFLLFSCLKCNRCIPLSDTKQIPVYNFFKAV